MVFVCDMSYRKKLTFCSKLAYDNDIFAETNNYENHFGKISNVAA